MKHIKIFKEMVENQKFTKHIQNGLKDVPATVVQQAALFTAGEVTGHGIKELTVDEQSYSGNVVTSKDSKSESYQNCNESHENIQGVGNETNENKGAGEKNSEPNNETNEEKEDDELEENMVCYNMGINEMNKQSETGKFGNQSKNENMNESESGRPNTTIEERTPEADDQNYEGYCRSTQQNPDVVGEESRANQSSNGESFELENREPSDEEADEPPEAMIKYRSKGAWFSKMIVTYYVKWKKIKKEASGDGKRVYIPVDAIDIEVRFQVRRPFWGDLMKYDRLKKTWCKPTTPHIFRYKKPTDRTFTLSGPLWWEAVTRVSDEYHEETKEMS